jgi:hypothetical protein
MLVFGVIFRNHAIAIHVMWERDVRLVTLSSDS